MKTMTLLSTRTAGELYARIADRMEQKGSNRGDHLRGFRIILEDIYREVCRDFNRGFADLYARMLFVSRVKNVPAAINQEAHGLRKVANRIAHEEVEIEGPIFLAAVKVIAHTIFFFSGKPIPASISMHYEGKSVPSLVQKDKQPRETIAFDRVVVMEIEGAKNGSFWRLSCASATDLGTYELYLRNNSRRDKYQMREDFLDLGRYIQPFSTLHVFDISKDASRDRIYHSSYKSAIVLEPDFLIDASFLAGAFFKAAPAKGKANEILSNPRWSLLKKFFATRPNPNLFRGNMADFLLDRMAFETELNFKTTFSEGCRKHPWQVVQLGAGGVRKIKAELSNGHLGNFRAFATHIRDKKIHIEPTFFSQKYGLQGRLDFLVEDETDAGRKDIYELKAGKAPWNTVEIYPAHLMQTCAYQLLLDSVYGNSLRGTAAVLYSEAGEKPIRDVPNERKMGQRLLMVRNQMVAEIFHLADNQHDFFSTIGNPEFGPASHLSWDVKNVDDFQRNYHFAKPIDRAFFNHFVSFVLRELRTGKIGDGNANAQGGHGFAGLWKASTAEKKMRFAIIDGLTFSRRRSRGRELFFKRKGTTASQVGFRKGDIVLVYPQEPQKSPLSYQILKATITRIEKDGVGIQLRHSQVDSEHFLSKKHWAIERDFMEKAFYTMLESLYGFLETTQDKRDLFLGQRPPRFEATPMPQDLDLIGKVHTPSQAKAIQMACLASDYMLIQGPPGTGKTSRVLTDIVLQLLRHTSQHIFVLAYTRKAVDKIAEHFQGYNRKHVGGEISWIRLASAAQEAADSLPEFAKNADFRQVEARLNRCRVFMGTVSSYLGHQHLLPAHISRDTVIIDEASQLIEPQLAGVLPGFKRFILIGDHNQLPAVVTQKAATCLIKDKTLLGAGYADFRTSFFERLWKQAKRNAAAGGKTAEKWAMATITLKEHFRMHKTIADLVNPYYGGMLRLGDAGRQAADLPAVSTTYPLQDVLSCNRIVFLESPPGEGNTNPVEAKRVLEVLRACQAGLPPGKATDYLGVISPWRAQINGIESLLQEEPDLKGIVVDTVERFQGAERHTIVLSLATSAAVQLERLCSPASSELGIEVDRKLNVSLSRAEERIIILGETAILRQNPHYDKLLTAIQSHGRYIRLSETYELFREVAGTDFDFPY